MEASAQLTELVFEKGHVFRDADQGPVVQAGEVPQIADGAVSGIRTGGIELN